MKFQSSNIWISRSDAGGSGDSKFDTPLPIRTVGTIASCLKPKIGHQLLLQKGSSKRLRSEWKTKENFPNMVYSNNHAIFLKYISKLWSI